MHKCVNKGSFFFVSDVPDPLEGGESRNSRWVGEEGEGLCLQMLIVADVELAQEC